jgi:ABC-2 type transport system ATP-binding protein
VLARAAAGGAAVVATTTYLEEAERGTTVLVLDAGRPLASGSLEAVTAGAPGTVATVGPGHLGEFRWRRGSTWRAWFPDGHLPAGATPITPDLADVVTVAAFARRREDSR